MSPVCYVTASDPPSQENLIDQVVDRFRPRLAISAKPTVCSDSVFLRRVSLDVTGFPATPEEIRSFLSDPSPTKRANLIDKLLKTERYSWKWGRWLAFQTGADQEELSYAAGEMGVSPERLCYAWIEWMQSRVAQDQPYCEIVTACLTATSREAMPTKVYYDWLDSLRSADDETFQIGEIYAAKPMNDLYWRRYSLSYDTAARGEDVARRFMGVGLECARCHDHPTDKWTMAEHKSFNALFAHVRYSELTLTHDQKTTVVASGLATGAVFSMGLLWAGVRSWRRPRFRLPTTIATGLLAGVLVFGGLCYLHLFIGALRSQQWSPGLWLASVGEKLEGWHMAYVIVVGCLLLIMPWSAMLARLIFSQPVSPGSRRVLSSWFWAAVLSGITWPIAADFVSIECQSGPVENRIALPHDLHRALLRLFGKGGAGLQPREIFLSRNRLETDVVPRFLDGTQVAVTAGSDPREELMLWLNRSDVPYLAETVINGLWEEYFGSRLTTENSDSDPVLAELRNALRTELSAAFHGRKQSLRSLHRLIMNSQLYQQASDDSELSATQLPEWLYRFPPRRLSAEQFVSAVDQLNGVRSDLGAGNAPKGGSAYQVGSSYPDGTGFGAAALRLLKTSDGDRALRTEAAMLMLVDRELQAKISDPGSWLQSQIDSQTTDQEIIAQLFLRAYGRELTPEEESDFCGEFPADVTREVHLHDIVWALINSAEFQFVF